jgi:hypothetical protein
MKKMTCFILTSFLTLMLYQNSSPQGKSSISPKKIDYQLSEKENNFLDTLQRRTFLYFWNEMNPDNGLVRDRSTEESPASIAATGFGIIACAVGAERGWIARQDGVNRTLRTLRFFWTSEQSKDSFATGYQGFYYHFLNMETGKRMWKSELSSVDTAWLIAGVRFAAQYYNGKDSKEQKIRDLADSLTFRINWDWLTHTTTDKYTSTISMGWWPEKGIHPMGWIGYNEALLLYIIAAGSGYSNAQKAYKQWLSNYDWQEPYEGFAHAVFPPLFGHQYSQMIVDFRGIADDYLQEKGIDYFENSRRAVLTQHQYCIENPNGWSGYNSLIWGLTACDGPGPDYNTENRQFHYYAGRGTSGPNLVYFDDGTIAPTAAGGSIVFAPEIVIPSLMAMYINYGPKGLWGPYGFYDAFNPTLNWIGKDYLGIDQGPIVLMIENFRTGLIWEYTMRDPVITEGLYKLGFRQWN